MRGWKIGSENVSDECAGAVCKGSIMKGQLRSMEGKYAKKGKEREYR